MELCQVPASLGRQWQGEEQDEKQEGKWMAPLWARPLLCPNTGGALI